MVMKNTRGHCSAIFRVRFVVILISTRGVVPIKRTRRKAQGQLPKFSPGGPIYNIIYIHQYIFNDNIL